jgi:hypothetical protein
MSIEGGQRVTLAACLCASTNQEFSHIAKSNTNSLFSGLENGKFGTPPDLF